MIAFADGQATAGCSDCNGTGLFDPFGLGPAADLTGMSFRVIFDIARGTHTTTWQTFVAGSIGAFTIESSSVPEPGTLALLMIGPLGFALHRRKPPANPGNEAADHR